MECIYSNALFCYSDLVKIFKSTNGQATIEYVLLFAFMTTISIGIVRSVGTGISSSVGSLGYVITKELQTGICARECFNNSYRNGLSE